jgi:hypothetical protein
MVCSAVHLRWMKSTCRLQSLSLVVWEAGQLRLSWPLHSRLPQEDAVLFRALQRQQDQGPVPLGSTRQEVPAAVDCIRVWRKFGASMRELQAVAVRLLSAHATSAATERNWSLWGRINCAARSLLGMQRAKALIAICAAEKSKLDPSQEFETRLSVLQGGE